MTEKLTTKQALLVNEVCHKCIDKFTHGLQNGTYVVLAAEVYRHLSYDNVVKNELELIGLVDSIKRKHVIGINVFDEENPLGFFIRYDGARASSSQELYEEDKHNFLDGEKYFERSENDDGVSHRITTRKRDGKSFHERLDNNGELEWWSDEDPEPKHCWRK